MSVKLISVAGLPSQNLKCNFVIFRVTLHIDVAKNLFDVSSEHVAPPKIKTVVPYTVAGGGFFFSVGNLIHNWSNNSQNYTLVLENDAKITSFHHLNPNELIVRSKSSVGVYRSMTGNKIYNLTKLLVCDQQKDDGLVLNNCAMNTSSDLGPIAIDYSKAAIYYADGFTVQRVSTNANRTG